MQNVRRELLIRNEESDNLIRFLEFIESNGGLWNRSGVKFDDAISVMTSIKAGIVLVLYNAIESTITKCLERLHEILQSQNLKFDECNDDIKHLILVYYENAKIKSSDVHRAVSYDLELYEYFKGEKDFGFTYGQLSKYYSLYSGNLDSKEIVSVLSKYGIDFNEKISELKTIKNHRNQLAHGELTFEEVGRNLTVQQLKHMKTKTFEYIMNVIAALENFIEEEKYRKS